MHIHLYASAINLLRGTKLYLKKLPYNVKGVLQDLGSSTPISESVVGNGENEAC